MKPLDMADKYDPLSYQDEDDEPTVKVHMPNFLPKVIVSEEGEEDFDLHGTRDTIPSPPTYPESHITPVKVGDALLGVFLWIGVAVLFWGGLGWLIFH